MNRVSDYVLNAADVLQHALPVILHDSVSGSLIFLLNEEKMIRFESKLKKCMLCGKCILVCPRGVNTRNVVILAKKAFQKSDEYAI